MKKRKELKRDKVAGTPAGIRESLKKATTEMLVLFLLERKPMYTYEMMSAVAQRSGGVIAFNTMYLSIYRLQDRGCIQEQGKVVSEDNRTRVYFAITPEGEAYLDRLEEEYRRYIRALDRVLEPEQQEGEEKP